MLRIRASQTNRYGHQAQMTVSISTVSATFHSRRKTEVAKRSSDTLSADWVLIDNELELPANPRRDANLKKVEDGDKKHKKQIDYPEILTSKVGSRRVPIPRPAVSYREEVIQYLAEHSAEIVLYQQELEARLATSINQNSNAQEQEQTAMMSKPQVTHQSSQLEADECGVGSTEGSESEE